MVISCEQSGDTSSLVKEGRPGRGGLETNTADGSPVSRPSIDGDLIPDSPHKLVGEGKFARIPVITGCNKDE